MKKSTVKMWLQPKSLKIPRAHVIQVTPSTGDVLLGFPEGIEIRYSYESVKTNYELPAWMPAIMEQDNAD